MWDYLGLKRDDLVDKNIASQVRGQDLDHQNAYKMFGRNGKYL